MSEPTETPEATTAGTLVSQLKQSKKIYDEYAKKIDNVYLVNGKLMKEWRKQFYVTMPPDMNPRLCLELGSKLIELHEEASYYKSKSEAELALLRTNYQQQFRAEFSKLVNEYKGTSTRLPAKDTLTALAEDQVSSVKDSMVHAEIEVAFWKEILSDLANSRKIIENATVNLATEAKALYNERYIDSLNRKGGYYDQVHKMSNQ